MVISVSFSARESRQISLQVIQFTHDLCYLPVAFHLAAVCGIRSVTLWLQGGRVWRGWEREGRGCMARVTCASVCVGRGRG